MEPDDIALVLACRRGEETAWDMLVARYERLIYSIALRTGVSHELASDVYQRVFILLLEHLDRIEQPGNIGAWLITTTRHEAWRLKRRESIAERLFSPAELPETLLDASPSAQEQLLQLEEQARVRAAVNMLDARCQTLIGLLYMQPTPPSYAEIATMLGTSEGSIGPTRARCLQKLRQLLEEDPE